MDIHSRECIYYSSIRTHGQLCISVSRQEHLGKQSNPIQKTQGSASESFPIARLLWQVTDTTSLKTDAMHKCVAGSDFCDYCQLTECNIAGSIARMYK